MKRKYEVRIPAISEKPEDFVVTEAESHAQAKYNVWCDVSDYYESVRYTDLRARLAKENKEK